MMKLILGINKMRNPFFKEAICSFILIGNCTCEANYNVFNGLFGIAEKKAFCNTTHAGNPPPSGKC
jgi:hypothetical protein